MADGAAPGAGGHAPEDEFDRALRALTEGTAGEARFRELSADERAKASAAAARAARKRRAEDLARAVRAERARTKRRRRRWDEPARPRGGRIRGVVAIIAAIALIGAGVFALQRFARPTAGGPDDSHLVTNGPTPSGTAGRSPTPAPIPAFAPPADPFAGTPADHWANGAAGIIVPEAKPVGPYTRAQVAAAYAMTRKLLIAQNLDRATLLGGAPDAFAALLTSKQRKEFLGGLNKMGSAKDGSPLSTRGWVTSFAPGTTALMGSVIKVHGMMSAREATNGHGNKYLAVDVNYRFVYSVEPPGAPVDWMRVVGELTGVYQFGHWESRSGPLQPWVASLPFRAGVRCDAPDGYVHPDYPAGPPDKVQPTGPAHDPYSMASPDKGADRVACRAATRT